MEGNIRTRLAASIVCLLLCGCPGRPLFAVVRSPASDSGLRDRESKQISPALAPDPRTLTSDSGLRTPDSRLNESSTPPRVTGGTLFISLLLVTRHLSLFQERAPKAPPTERPLSLEDRADIFMARKSYAEAVDYYYRALKQTGPFSPGSASLWNKLGIACQQQLQFGAARKAYNQALRRRDNFPEAWNNMGTTYFLTDKFSKSLKYYRKAIQLNPNSASFHLNLGTSYYRLKKWKEAVEEYRQALSLDPNILTEHSTMGTVLQARGNDVDYYFYMAKVFASLGRIDEAVRYLRRAFEDGFKDVKRLDDDPDFLKISKDPSYTALRSNPPVPIRD